MIYTYVDIRKNKMSGSKLWGYIVEPAKSQTFRFARHIKPVLGVTSSDCKMFTPFNKDGTLSKSKYFSTFGMLFSDNEQEAIDDYNRKIMEQVDMLKEKAQELRGLLIK